MADLNDPIARRIEPLILRLRCGVDKTNEQRELSFDLEFALSLSNTLDRGDPGLEILRRALGDAANLIATTNEDARARKVLRDAMGSLNGEFRHAIYPMGMAPANTENIGILAKTQLDLLARYPDYNFALPQARHYAELERLSPKLFSRVKAAVEAKRWEAIGSVWCDADCEQLGPEALVRLLLYGRRFVQTKFATSPVDLWLSGMSAAGPSMPQILAKFNIGSVVVQMPDEGHNTFWWQGIDGSRVWTHVPPGRSHSASPESVVDSVKNYRDHGRADQSLYLFGADDAPNETHLELLARGRLAPNYPEVLLGKRAVDFYREAKSRSADLAVWYGALNQAAGPRAIDLSVARQRAQRRLEFLLRDAELLSAFAPGFPRQYSGKRLEQAWKMLLEDSDNLHEAYSFVEEIADSALTAIGEKFETTNITKPVAIFHFARVPGQVSVPWNDESVPTVFVTEEDTVPVQVVDDFGERNMIFRTPAGALKAVAVGGFSDSVLPKKTRLKVSTSGRRIENSEWSVRFDTNGNIAGIQSLEDNSEFIEPGKLANLFFVSACERIEGGSVEHMMPAGRQLLKSDRFEVVERGPVRVAVMVEKSFGNSRIRQRISLGPTAGVRFDTEIDWQERDRLLRVHFPINVNPLHATHDVQFGSAVRAAHTNGQPNEFFSHKWVDLSEGDQGVALINDGAAMVDVRQNNFRMLLLGPDDAMARHRISYSLVPHFDPHNYANIVAASYAFNAEARVAWLESSPGVVGTIPPFVFCENRNIVLQSVKKAEVGSAVVVRLFECHNTRGRAELQCIRPFRTAWLCDLEENELIELDPSDSTVSFDFKPFEILTIKLKG